jgi:hypothetical protein
MAQTKQFSILKTTPFFAAVALAILGAPAPALAQTAFGQEMPQQYFLNKMVNPARPAPEAASSGAGGPAQAANAAKAANAEDDDGPGPYPKKFLLNRMFNW